MGKFVRSEATVRELLYYSYANLAMAHYAVKRGDEKYTRTAYMIRAKLYKGLLEGTMTMGSFFDDEKVKLQQGHICSYCVSSDGITFDHLISRALNGKDSSDNLVVACRSCNSSKRDKDLLVWCRQHDKFPPLMILRRYLKIAVQICHDADVMDCFQNDARLVNIPISFDDIPTKFPVPADLRL